MLEEVLEVVEAAVEVVPTIAALVPVLLVPK